MDQVSTYAGQVPYILLILTIAEYLGVSMRSLIRLTLVQVAKPRYRPQCLTGIFDDRLSIPTLDPTGIEWLSTKFTVLRKGIVIS